MKNPLAKNPENLGYRGTYTIGVLILRIFKMDTRTDRNMLYSPNTITYTH